MGKVTELNVLVHPHWMLSHLNRHIKGGDAIPVTLSKKGSALAGENKVAERELAELETHYRRYKNMIDRIRRRRGAKMVILTNPPDTVPRGWVSKSKWMGWHVPAPQAGKMLDFSEALQLRVVGYARSKLGKKRLLVTNATPEQAGSTVRKGIGELEGHVPVHVFGEMHYPTMPKDGCVNRTNASLQKAGYLQARIIREQSYH